jgi:hypothetical protein
MYRYADLLIMIIPACLVKNALVCSSHRHEIIIHADHITVFNPACTYYHLHFLLFFTSQQL